MNARTLIFVALAGGALSCSQKQQPVAAAVPSSCDTGEAVVATYAGKKVTLKEVDAAAGPRLKELDKQRFDLRMNTLKSVLMTALVKEAATKEGKTEDQWRIEHVDGKVPQPAEADVLKVFKEAEARLPPGTTLETVKPQIVEYLTATKKQEALEGAFGELLKQANGEVLFEEPRVQVEAKGPSRGPADAKVTIVEFSDFQCPFCSKAEDAVEQVMTAHAGKVRVVYRHFPLNFHNFAAKAAEAAACAQEQEKFWEYHHQLFKNQQKLAVADLKEHATAIGLNAEKFNECLDSGRSKTTVDADMAEGTKAGVSGTPAFFVNGIFLNGAQPFDAFDKVIKSELARAK